MTILGTTPTKDPSGEYVPTVWELLFRVHVVTPHRFNSALNPSSAVGSNKMLTSMPDKQLVHLKTLCKTPQLLSCLIDLLQLATLSSATDSPEHHTTTSERWRHTHHNAWSTHSPWQDPHVPSTNFHETN